MRSLSISIRALIALLLMIGFYCLAVGFTLVLLWIPYAEVVYANRLHFKLAAVCVIGAVLILWSIVPRRDRFAAPGPELTAEQEPRLFALIREIADATGQRMPRAVYLVPEVNAWVTQRGGVIGIGSRRVMGIGLPLLVILRVSELRAVLAHEFGHFYSGDTGLGRLVYQTRTTLMRTVVTLVEHESILQLPFIWYARLFLWISHAVSRQQEYAADRLAARSVGAKPLIDGLTTVHGGAVAFSSYWSDDVVPVLQAGWRPPLAEGFGRFVAGPLGSRLLDMAMDAARASGRQDPYDTHPPLPDRIRALEALQDGGRIDGDLAALALVHDLSRLERRLIEHLMGAEPAARMQAVEWDAVGSRVYRVLWEGVARECAGYLTGLTIEGFGERVPQLVEAIGVHYVRRGPEAASAEVRRQRGEWALGVMLALAASRKGWIIRAAPGERVTVESPEGSIDPFATVHELASGAIDGQTWHRRCAELGLTGIEMLPTSSAAVTETPAVALPTRPVTAPRVATRHVRETPALRDPPNTVQCWRCKTAITYTDETRGKKIRCPSCGTKQEMPF